MSYDTLKIGIRIEKNFGFELWICWNWKLFPQNKLANKIIIYNLIDLFPF